MNSTSNSPAPARPPVRVAMTQTGNAYRPMPDRVEDLLQLEGKLELVRRANVDHHLELIAAAAAHGARLVGLGELFTAPYFALGEIGAELCELWRHLAEDASSGPTVTALRAAAKLHGVLLVAPLYELDVETGQRFNTAVLIDEAGRLLGKYRKNHIPAGSNELGAFQETRFYGPGQGRLNNDPAINVSTNEHYPVFRTSVGRLGIAICYDRHFEGVMRTLAANGAELVFCPAVTFGAHSRRMWELEFPVDAARHRIFVAGSNRCGTERPWGQEYFGSSYFTGPDGRVPTLDGPAELVMADLDLGALEGDCGSGWDLARDVRPETYG